MAMAVPTREALRALARLCNLQQPAARHIGSSTKRSTHTIAQKRVLLLRTTPSMDHQVRTKTTIIDGPEPQTFANDPSKWNAQDRNAPEPRHQGTVDPQSTASGPAIPDITNYYTLFPRTIPNGPPQPPSRVPDSSTLIDRDPAQSAFYINPRDLRQEFLKLQSLHHPDKYPAGSQAHQKAYALSTLLNNAYKTLSDPLLRSQYLLQILYDIDVTSEDNSAHPSDTETLMIVMEAQEELENATDNGGEEAVQRLNEENKVRIRQTEKELSDAFESGDAEKAKEWAVKLKYWKSLESGLQEWEPGKEVRLTH